MNICGKVSVNSEGYTYVANVFNRHIQTFAP